MSVGTRTIVKMTEARKVTFHRDGTVTYYNEGRARWETHVPLIMVDDFSAWSAADMERFDIKLEKEEAK